MDGRDRNADRRELQRWYLSSLAPKLAEAAAAGVVQGAAAASLDRDVRTFLDLPADRREREAA